MSKYDFFDFHIHTHYSDGDPDQSPDKVVALASQVGCKHISITDHDHLLPEEERKQLSLKYNIDLVPGCEFSCIWTVPDTKEEVIIHLGGHWLNTSDPHIRQIVEFSQGQDFEGRVKEMLYLYRQEKPHPALRDLDEAYEKIKQANPHSKHIAKRATAKFLVSEGCEPDRQSAYHQLACGGAAFVPPTKYYHYPPLEEVMEAITKQSTCTLNHLYYYHLSDADNHTLLRRFKDLGGHSLETIYTYYEQEKRFALLQLCEDYDFLPNCGSDRHDDSREFINGPDLLFRLLQKQQLNRYGTLNYEP